MVIRVRLEELRDGRTTAVLYDEQAVYIGQGAVVCAAARKLLKRGYRPDDRLEAWRGNMLCLAGSLGTFARLTVDDSPRGRIRFRPYRPGPRGEGGSPPNIEICREARPEQASTPFDAPGGRPAPREATVW